MSVMVSVSDWIRTTSFSEAVRDHFWVVPTVQSIHILAISVVVASMAMLDLRLAGLIGREQSVRDLTAHFFPRIWQALLVLLATGLILIMGEPSRELLNWVFWTKMALILVAVGFTLPMRAMLEDRRFRDLSPRKQLLLRLCALASLLGWVAVVTCGRWIGYIGGNL